MSTRSVRRVFAALALAPVLTLSALAGTPAGSPAAPAVADSFGPIKVAGLGIKNFGVVDGRIYRGAQPKDEDFAALKQLGVTTVVDLRLDARKGSRAEAEAAGLRYVNIRIDDHKQPTDADVAAFVALLDRSPDAKVYVHCAGGRHRTGSMIAVYRLVHCGWSIDEAYGEMKAYDFYTRNGHKGFKDYVFEYYKRMTENPSSVPAAFRTETATTAPAEVAAP